MWRERENIFRFTPQTFDFSYLSTIQTYTRNLSGIWDLGLGIWGFAVGYLHGGSFRAAGRPVVEAGETATERRQQGRHRSRVAGGTSGRWRWRCV